MSLAADVLVAVDRVEKHWDETSGLQALTMEVRVRELVVVRGRSGTGKSTLLAMIAGWCPPDRGTIIWGPAFEGCDITVWDQVAVVPQVLALMGELSARENIEVALRGCGVSRAAASERADEVIDALFLDELAATRSWRDVTRSAPTHGDRPCDRGRAEALARRRADEPSGCGERPPRRRRAPPASRGGRRAAGHDPRRDGRRRGRPRHRPRRDLRLSSLSRRRAARRTPEPGATNR